MESIANRKKLKIRLALVTFLIYFLNWAATKFYWYNSIWWFDMMMHFLGGVWVAFILLWFIPIEMRGNGYFIKLALGVVVIGLAWEVFEFLVNNRFAQNPFDILDALSDLFFDTMGGLVTIFYFSKRIMIKGASTV